MTPFVNDQLVTLLESTLNPSLRKQAEDELGNVSISSFCSLCD